MKKSYLMIAAAVLTFAACSNNDYVKEIVDENEAVLIGFETFHEKATKAAVNTAANLTDANGGFGVFGFNHTDNKTVSSGSIDVSAANTVFNNVKVWYSAGADTKEFTYEVPKYWDKYKYYTFFAYAPYNASTVSLTKTTGKFTRTDVASLQSTNSTTTVTVGSNSRTKYDAADETGVVDYLIAVCVPGQKYAATNQSGYTGYEKTVGFTFNHILSKLNVNVQAKNEATTGHQYKGVSDIQVSSLFIENLPNVSSSVTYTQTNADGALGTFTPANYTTNLNIIGGTNATTAGPLYILDGGASGSPIVAPTTYINQNFHYFVAPNTPTGTDHDKYYLNIAYTINYVDGTSDPFTRRVDLSALTAAGVNPAVATTAFTSMVQNYVYNINVTIGLDQIYFAVDEVTDWATAVNTDVTIN